MCFPREDNPFDFYNLTPLGEMAAIIVVNLAVINNR